MRRKKVEGLKLPDCIDNNQDSMATAIAQTKRSVEENGKPRNRLSHIWTTDFLQRFKGESIEKEQYFQQ